MPNGSSVRTTFLAVKEVLSATHSAYTTAIAMKLSFLSVIIIKFAQFTEILSHINTTISTHGRHVLLLVANQTHDLPNIMPRKIMPILGIAKRAGFLIVAMAAGEDLITTWGANHASSFVMLASMFHFSEMIALICRSFHGLQENVRRRATWIVNKNNALFTIVLESGPAETNLVRAYPCKRI
eukprot:TRINITY_DN4062_c0_g2_i6.p1 TRINITY_DN4062_c0_g2~~TRINITY_DN4062_c0_g2_i6.p1  ORF type:complete len:183 (-),score=10.29 TRINITY_DN4062_c0_g2_i6:105-653(-)